MRRNISKGRRSRRGTGPGWFRNADLLHFPTGLKKRNRYSGIDDGGDEFKAFRKIVQYAFMLTDEIATYRDFESVSRDAESGRVMLRDRLSAFRETVAALETNYPNALRRLTLGSELEEWRKAVETLRRGTMPKDEHIAEPDELDVARAQLQRWETLAATHRVFARQLQIAVRKPPSSEAEVQDVAESLLIGNDIPYIRECPVWTPSFERRRTDFYVPPVELAVELKHCASSSRAAAIQDEIRADQSFAADGRRLLFVIYDIGSIRDPVRYSHDLEQFFPYSAHRSVSVHVVKH